MKERVFHRIFCRASQIHAVHCSPRSRAISTRKCPFILSPMWVQSCYISNDCDYYDDYNCIGVIKSIIDLFTKLVFQFNE